MAQNRETREVQNPAFLEVGCDPDVLIWREQVGLFRALDNPDRKVSVGTPGISDSVMAVTVTITPDMVGKRIAVCAFPEFKTKTGKQRTAQLNWQNAAAMRCAPYRLIRSPAEMRQFVRDIQSGRAFF